MELWNRIIVEHRFDLSIVRFMRALFGGGSGETPKPVENVKITRIDNNVVKLVNGYNSLLEELKSLREDNQQMNADIQALVDVAKENNTVTKSIVALVKDLATKIINSDDLAAVKQLATDMRAETAEIAAAVTENTPAEGEDEGEVVVDPANPPIDPATGRPRINTKR